LVEGGLVALLTAASAKVAESEPERMRAAAMHFIVRRLCVVLIDARVI
jgi:hypothetical protein